MLYSIGKKKKSFYAFVDGFDPWSYPQSIMRCINFVDFVCFAFYTIISFDDILKIPSSSRKVL
jgi:hypothetical protein